MPSRVLVCLPRNFYRTMSLSPLIDGARCPLAEEIDACIRQDRQAEMHSDPDRDFFFFFFLSLRDTVLLSAKSEYLQTHIYEFTTRITSTQVMVNHW